MGLKIIVWNASAEILWRRTIQAIVTLHIYYGYVPYKCGYVPYRCVEMIHTFLESIHTGVEMIHTVVEMIHTGIWRWSIQVWRWSVQGWRWSIQVCGDVPYGCGYVPYRCGDDPYCMICLRTDHLQTIYYSLITAFTNRNKIETSLLVISLSKIYSHALKPTASESLYTAL